MIRNHVKMCTVLFIFLTVVTYGFCQLPSIYDKLKYQVEVEQWLNKIEPSLGEFKALLHRLNWKLQTEDFDDKANLQLQDTIKVRNKWENQICSTKLKFNWLTRDQKRKLYLFCRGVKFTEDMLIPYSQIMGKSLLDYDEAVCIPSYIPFETQDLPEDFPRPGQCVNGEPDLERFMRNTSHTTEQLNYIWLTWYNSVGPRIKNDYYVGIMLQNVVAKKSGYNNMGEIWREELEIPNLEKTVENLYTEIEPFYVALHAVVRYKLFKKYGRKIIDPKGPIPIHVLGNMWGQDWSSLIDLFVTNEQLIALDKRLKGNHNSEKSLALEAEDFYTSLGLPKLPGSFWKYSIFEKRENNTLCHGTAANLFHGDYRMIMCGEVSMEGLYIIHHEMGHIYYYMAYEHQDSLFRDGTNTAIHESIGDAIMHGVMTPQHLNRIGVLTDKELYDPDIETFLLFQQALNKLPELPFALALDKYRWDIFRESITYNDFNNAFWKLNLKYRGVVPPEERDEEYFDAGAKFHVPDNTPYIRYFLSGIIQMDIFKSFCELSLFNKTNNVDEDSVPLHRCDIYGSKDSGQRLWSMMEKGSRVHWSEALKILTGHSYISTKPLLEYYKPVYDWLLQYIDEHNIYVGW